MSSRRELKDKRKNDGQKRRRDVRQEVAGQYLKQRELLEDQYLTKLCLMPRWRKWKFCWLLLTTRPKEQRKLVKNPEYVPEGAYLLMKEPEPESSELMTEIPKEGGDEQDRNAA